MKKIVLFSLLIFLFAPFIGANDLMPSSEVFWLFRFPRLMLAVVCGACLGVSGLVFQTIFQNPLTTPYTLGLASGAAFGATLAILSGISASFAGAVICFAVLGALSTVVIILCFSLFSLQKQAMLLIGVALSFFFASMMLFLTYISDIDSSFRSMRWLMGSLDIVGFDSIFLITPFVVLGIGVCVFYSRDLDVISTGDELAMSRGVDVNKTKQVLFFVISIMTGVCVSVVGPIGFIGLIVPHITKLFAVRGLAASNHRQMIIACAFLSASFLVVCDLFSRIASYPAEVPIGVITALIGTPFFIFYLFRAKY